MDQERLLNQSKTWTIAKEDIARAHGLGQSIVTSQLEALSKLAADLDMSERHIHRQYLLHAPQFEMSALQSPSLLARGAAMRNILTQRATSFLLNKRVLDEGITISHEKPLTSDDLLNGTIHLMPVAKDVSFTIEDKLHYLMNFREDAVYRYGLFHRNDEWPFAYVSVAVCDRNYLRDAAYAAIGAELAPDAIANICRIFASDRAPRNSISILISRVMSRLRIDGFKLYTTALNPFLLFSGSSLLASNYVLFASCPVAFGYDTIGLYASRRSLSQHRTVVWQPPNNYIFMRSNIPKVSRQVRKLSYIVPINNTAHAKLGDAPIRQRVVRDLRATLEELRSDLEDVWGENTRYHKIDFNPKKDAVSKGQCGVTSMFLARQLSIAGHNALFCEGNAFLPDVPPILQHCWLVIPAQRNAVSDEDVVIDITADQTGFPQAVICDRIRDLERLGIFYKESSRTDHTTVGVAHLRSRLQILQREIGQRNGGNLDV